MCSHQVTNSTSPSTGFPGGASLFCYRQNEVRRGTSKYTGSRFLSHTVSDLRESVSIGTNQRLRFGNILLYHVIYQSFICFITLHLSSIKPVLRLFLRSFLFWNSITSHLHLDRFDTARTVESRPKFNEN